MRKEGKMVTLYFQNEEEKFAFLDRLHAGDPVVWGELTILEYQQKQLSALGQTGGSNGKTLSSS